jgi:ABC-type multidrug transport system fused ATPase/permease subunit
MLMPALLAPRYDWQLLLAPLFFIVTYVLALVRYMNVLRAIADRVRLAFGSLNSRLAEAIDGIEMVKASAQEAQETACSAVRGNSGCRMVSPSRNSTWLPVAARQPALRPIAADGRVGWTRSTRAPSARARSGLPSVESEST